MRCGGNLAADPWSIGHFEHSDTSGEASSTGTKALRRSTPDPVHRRERGRTGCQAPQVGARPNSATTTSPWRFSGALPVTAKPELENCRGAAPSNRGRCAAHSCDWLRSVETRSLVGRLPRDDRESRHLGIRHPHVVLELRHVLRGRELLRERPRQHELGLVDSPSPLHDAIEGGRHPPDDRVFHPVIR
jgi:hypothetical protein